MDRLTRERQTNAMLSAMAMTNGSAREAVAMIRSELAMLRGLADAVETYVYRPEGQEARARFYGILAALSELKGYPPHDRDLPREGSLGMDEDIRAALTAARIDIDRVMWTPDGLHRIRVDRPGDPGDFVEFDEYLTTTGTDQTWRAVLYRTYRPIGETEGSRDQVIGQVGRWIS